MKPPVGWEAATFGSVLSPSLVWVMQRTFSKMGGGSKDNTQWYYIDQEKNYVGPVNTHKMKQLKKLCW